MNTVERLNTVIDYVEKHITEKLNLNQLAEIACYSLHDFQRMFTFITEMSITEYIRKRRLTLAGFDLQQNNAKVMNVALKYDYESPVSFARAFQAFHKVKPSEAKKSNISLKIFPRLIFQINVKEVSQIIRADKITVNEKEYEASYFGEQDMSSWHDDYKSREIWRLENAYGDFKDNQKTGTLKPCSDYNFNIETGQVFVMELKKRNSNVERLYYISDGTVFKGIPATSQITVPKSAILGVEQMILETERCIIRPININDKLDLYSLCVDVDVWKYLGGISTAKYHMKNIENLEKYLPDHNRWIIRDKTNNLFFGVIILWASQHDDGDVHLAYMLLSKHCGNGYASEAVREIIRYAFDLKRLNRIFAETQSAHLDSCKLLKKLGFHKIKERIRFNAEQTLYVIDNPAL